MTTYTGQGATAAEAGPDIFESSGSSSEVTIEKFSIVDFPEVGDIVEVTYNSQTYSGIYTGTDGSSFVIYVSSAPDPTNPYLIVGPSPVPAGETTTITTDIFVVCFLAGTMIATQGGGVAIETLKAGDLVNTSDGSTKPVRWLARQTVSTFFADPMKVMPVRIAAGALGEGLPLRDLYVSNDHALEIDGVLVQAGALVNGTSIVRNTAMPTRFVYFHVEFATLTWVDWFNHRRLLEPIGNIPPAEAEERYYAMLEEQEMAA